MTVVAAISAEGAPKPTAAPTDTAARKTRAALRRGTGSRRDHRRAIARIGMGYTLAESAGVDHDERPFRGSAVA
jgi:hypothetical protein